MVSLNFMDLDQYYPMYRAKNFLGTGKIETLLMCHARYLKEKERENRIRVDAKYASR